MNSIKALNIVLAISLVGVLFSGYLTISELPNIGAATCSLGGCQMILGLPTCMYGLAMYLAVFIVALLGRKN